MISTCVTPSAFTYNYPLLMESRAERGLLVLFSSAGTGTLVAVPGRFDDAPEVTVGHHADDWNMNVFEIFNGNIDLCNEADGGFDDEEEINWPDDKQDPCQGCTEPDCAMQGGENHALGDLGSAIGVDAAQQADQQVQVRYTSLDEVLKQIMATGSAKGTLRG